MFDNDTKLPLLIDFGLSAIIGMILVMNKCQKFFMSLALIIMFGLEVHYISYLINENKDPSQEELVNIVEEFVDNNKGITKNFSESFSKNKKQMFGSITKI